MFGLWYMQRLYVHLNGRSCPGTVSTRGRSANSSSGQRFKAESAWIQTGRKERNQKEMNLAGPRWLNPAKLEEDRNKDKCTVDMTAWWAETKDGRPAREERELDFISVVLHTFGPRCQSHVRE